MRISTELRVQSTERLTVRKFWEFTLVGFAVGAVLGWLLSLVSGNIFVIIGIGTLGTVVGTVLGIIHRNDP